MKLILRKQNMKLLSSYQKKLSTVLMKFSIMYQILKTSVVADKVFDYIKKNWHPIKIVYIYVV